MKTSRLTLCLALAGAVGAQGSIGLEGVPKQLRLPLDGDANVVLTATVRGGAARSVWLATSAESRGRLLLTATDKDRWSVNLADPLVVALLRHDGGHRRFHVFAELDDGKVLSSVAVNCSLAPARIGPARPRLAVQGRPDLRVPPGETRWVTPATVDRLVVRFAAKRREVAVAGWIGTEKYPFLPMKGTSAAELTVSSGLRKAWAETGELSIRYHDADDDGQTFRLRTRPDRLRSPGNAHEFAVDQRGSKEIPGTNGYLTLSIDDITAGQTVVRVCDAEGRIVLEDLSMRAGDDTRIRIGREPYTLSLKKLVNHLFDDDLAIFVVSKLANPEREKIDKLLERIENSEHTFIREGVESSGRVAAAVIRRKYASAGPHVATAVEFIDKIASRSSTTGRPYRVKIADEIVPAKEWLLGQLAEVEREVAPEKRDAGKDKKK